VIVIATVLRLEGQTGVQAHTAALHHGLERAGVSCRVATPFGGSRRWLPLFAVRPLLLRRARRSWSTRWYRHWHFVALRANLERTLVRGDVRAVVAQDPLSGRAALEARQRARVSVPITVVCHFNVSQADEFRAKGELTDDRAYERIRRLEADVLTNADAVVYVSNWSREVIEERRGIRPRRSSVIWNGIPVEIPALASTRSDLGIPVDAIVLANIGTIEPRKNQLGLVDLFARIHAEEPATHLLLVGDGPQRNDVERKLSRLGLQDRAVLVGARRNGASFLELADVYVHYAHVENLPLSLLEAARAGKPIAAPATGGMGELLAALRGTVSVDPDDLAQSLRALRPLIQDPAARAELGAQARDAFLRSFTADAMIRAYRDHLAHLPGQ